MSVQEAIGTIVFLVVPGISIVPKMKMLGTVAGCRDFRRGERYHRLWQLAPRGQDGPCGQHRDGDGH